MEVVEILPTFERHVPQYSFIILPIFNLKYDDFKYLFKTQSSGL